MTNDITELRSVLFDTLRDLRNKEATVDLDRVRIINDIAKTVSDTAKIEVDYARVTGAVLTSGFLPDLEKPAAKPAAVPAPPAQPGVAAQLVAANVTTHRMR